MTVWINGDWYERAPAPPEPTPEQAAEWLLDWERYRDPVFNEWRTQQCFANSGSTSRLCSSVD